MAEPDKARRAAWGSAAVISASLLFAGFVYEPRPSVDALFSTGEFELRLGLRTEAREKLEEVLDRAPDHAYAHLLVGYLDLADRDFAAALTHYEAGEALIRDADDPALLGDWYVTMGQLRLYTGDFVGAGEFAEVLLSTEHRPAAAFLIRGFSRLAAGADTTFRQDLERAFVADPTDPFFKERAEFVTGAIPWAAAFTIGAGRGPRP